MAENRLLEIILANKLRWDTHTDTLCKTLFMRVFILSKLKNIVDTDTLKLFFNAHIKSHIDYVMWGVRTLRTPLSGTCLLKEVCRKPLSGVWGGCSDALKKQLNSLLRRSGKQILPDKNLTTDQKLISCLSCLNINRVCKTFFLYIIVSPVFTYSTV